MRRPMRASCGPILKAQRPEVLRMLERIETWRMWVLCDREPVKEWSKGRGNACSATPPIPCCSILAARRLHGHGGRGLARR